MKSHAGTTQTIPQRGELLRRLLRRAMAATRPLTILGSIMLVTFLATVVGIFVDDRVITGAPAWLKPAKFAISVSVYCFTFGWLLYWYYQPVASGRTLRNQFRTLLRTRPLTEQLITVPLSARSRGIGGRRQLQLILFPCNRLH